MKRVVSILLALALVLSLSVTAFAAENDGSITITNATIDQTYTLYKIFDASIKVSENGENTEAIAYTIDESNYFFDKLFPNTLDEESEDPYANDYLIYTPSTDKSGGITKRASVQDPDLIKYLMKLVYNEVPVLDENGDPVLNADGTEKKEYELKDGVPYVASKEADGKVVKFENLPYGYYLITSTLGTAVTINSADPDATVIDKNQDPVPDFNKQVQTGVGADGKPTWGDANSAEIGDGFKYRISFTATNYDGDKQIKYYQVHDEKGDAIWAEFDSFKVVVGGKELPRGYYLSQGGENTGNWGFLNEESTHEDSWSKLPAEKKTRENAQWYLVHLGYDSFRITIPWLEEHTLTDNVNESGVITSYTLGFKSETSKFASPVQVEITYDVVLEGNAAIGNTSHGNRFNKAYASWTSAHETGSNTPDEVVTHTYGIGLLKDDGSTGQNLAGAKFRIYSDAACTQPVHVIPTDLDGVYVVDSKNKAIEGVSGDGVESTRKIFLEYPGYAEILKAYLVDDKGDEIAQNNLVVSQVNGKLAVLGLKAGSYYLKEVEAPDGYNALSTPVELKAGDNIRPFFIYADNNGHVADIQAETGNYKENRLDLTHTVVHNSKGVELPSTGGKGTVMMITFGTMIAMAFAVLLITQKKMTIYHD